MTIQRLAGHRHRGTDTSDEQQTDAKAAAAARSDDFHRLAMMLDSQASTVAATVTIADGKPKEQTI